MQIPRSKARQLRAAARRMNRDHRPPNRKARRGPTRSKRSGKSRYFVTASAVWVVRGSAAVTVVAISDEDLASVLVWLLMGTWP